MTAPADYEDEPLGMTNRIVYESTKPIEPDRTGLRKNIVTTLIKYDLPPLANDYCTNEIMKLITTSQIELLGDMIAAINTGEAYPPPRALKIVNRILMDEINRLKELL